MAGLLWYRSYMDSLANTNGYYPDIHAGHADRVTELTLKAPYLVRETPAGYNQLELAQIIGGTMVVEGSLQSVEATAHVIVGFNQWDEEWETGTIDVETGGDVPSNARMRCKNQIPIFPNTEYAFTIASETGSFDTFRVVYYDASGQYISGTAYFPQGGYATSPILFTTPANAFFMRFSTPTVYGVTYKGDICINLSKPTGTPKNGDYVPYVKRTYPLANVTLRGISTTVDGVLSYDGDTYDPDGTVTRYFGERAYQAGDENLPDAVTDGTNTVYKLTTPVTESAAPYTSTQTVEAGGMVQFVTSNNIPVGNVSIYRRV